MQFKQLISIVYFSLIVSSVAVGSPVVDATTEVVANGQAVLTIPHNDYVKISHDTITIYPQTGWQIPALITGVLALCGLGVGTDTGTACFFLFGGICVLCVLGGTAEEGSPLVCMDLSSIQYQDKKLLWTMIEDILITQTEVKNEEGKPQQMLYNVTFVPRCTDLTLDQFSQTISIPESKLPISRAAFLVLVSHLWRTANRRANHVN